MHYFTCAKCGEEGLMWWVTSPTPTEEELGWYFCPRCLAYMLEQILADSADLPRRLLREE